MLISDQRVLHIYCCVVSRLFSAKEQQIDCLPLTVVGVPPESIHLEDSEDESSLQAVDHDMPSAQDLSNDW